MLSRLNSRFFYALPFSRAGTITDKLLKICHYSFSKFHSARGFMNG